MPTLAAAASDAMANSWIVAHRCRGCSCANEALDDIVFTGTALIIALSVALADGADNRGHRRGLPPGLSQTGEQLTTDAPELVFEPSNTIAEHRAPEASHHWARQHEHSIRAPRCLGGTVWAIAPTGIGALDAPVHTADAMAEILLPAFPLDESRRGRSNMGLMGNRCDRTCRRQANSCGIDADDIGELGQSTPNCRDLTLEFGVPLFAVRRGGCHVPPFFGTSCELRLQLEMFPFQSQQILSSGCRGLFNSLQLPVDNVCIGLDISLLLRTPLLKLQHLARELFNCLGPFCCLNAQR